MMLLRLISKPSQHLRFFLPRFCAAYPLPSSSSPSLGSPQSFDSANFTRHFSNGDDRIKRGANNDAWTFSPEEEEAEAHTPAFEENGTGDDPWSSEKVENEDDVFTSIGKDEEKGVGLEGADGDWMMEEDTKPWNLGEEDNKADSIFDMEIESREEEEVTAEDESLAEKRKGLALLEKEEEELKSVLKGPNRAFGDLITASGITDAMLDNLIALKDFEGIDGLPPLNVIEDIRHEKNTRTSTRRDIERKKQDEVAKARVRTVDENGRAYGTGRRKCSIARVWIMPGNGGFVVNLKQFDAYFPDLGHRAALLRPFSETKTLGQWDVNCTVRGGGTSGQVGAIRLGISRALQNWEPGLRPPLKAAGLLTRDSRVVERKKPGKAKARKSFQWVKR